MSFGLGDGWIITKGVHWGYTRSFSTKFSARSQFGELCRDHELATSRWRRLGIELANVPVAQILSGEDQIAFQDRRAKLQENYDKASRQWEKFLKKHQKYQRKSNNIENLLWNLSKQESVARAILHEMNVFGNQLEDLTKLTRLQPNLPGIPLRLSAALKHKWGARASYDWQEAIEQLRPAPSGSTENTSATPVDLATNIRLLQRHWLFLKLNRHMTWVGSINLEDVDFVRLVARDLEERYTALGITTWRESDVERLLKADLSFENARPPSPGAASTAQTFSGGPLDDLLFSAQVYCDEVSHQGCNARLELYNRTDSHLQICVVHRWSEASETTSHSDHWPFSLSSGTLIPTYTISENDRWGCERWQLRWSIDGTDRTISMRSRADLYRAQAAFTGIDVAAHAHVPTMAVFLSGGKSMGQCEQPTGAGELQIWAAKDDPPRNHPVVQSPSSPSFSSSSAFSSAHRVMSNLSSVSTHSTSTGREYCVSSPPPTPMLVGCCISGDTYTMWRIDLCCSLSRCADISPEGKFRLTLQASRSSWRRKATSACTNQKCLASRRSQKLEIHILSVDKPHLAQWNLLSLLDQHSAAPSPVPARSAKAAGIVLDFDTLAQRDEFEKYLSATIKRFGRLLREHEEFVIRSRNQAHRPTLTDGEPLSYVVPSFETPPNDGPPPIIKRKPVASSSAFTAASTISISSRCEAPGLNVSHLVTARA